MLKLETIGNIGNDAEIKKINQNEFVCFNVAAQVKKKDASGQYVKDTQWVSVYWYGNGGALFQYLKKGTKVFVRGDLVVKEFTTQNGQYGYSLTVNANEVQLCGSANNNSAQQPTQAPTQQENKTQQQPQSQRTKTQEDDDLPF